MRRQEWPIPLLDRQARAVHLAGSSCVDPDNICIALDPSARDGLAVLGRRPAGSSRLASSPLARRRALAPSRPTLTLRRLPCRRGRIRCRREPLHRMRHPPRWTRIVCYMCPAARSASHRRVSISCSEWPTGTLRRTPRCQRSSHKGAGRRSYHADFATSRTVPDALRTRCSRDCLPATWCGR
jgi:hypothetical protein